METMTPINVTFQPTTPTFHDPPVIPFFFGPNDNSTIPRIFHGDVHGAVFTSGGAIPNGKICTDLNGRKIPSNLHYVPGPDDCTLCVCHDGGPKWCKAVLCSPPQDCKSFRVGSSCCDFICLDESLNKGSGGKTGGPFNGSSVDLTDVVPKILVVAITSILSMSLLLFLIHRLRQKQTQGRLNSSAARRCGDECADSRSIDFSMDFFDRAPPPHYLSWWKSGPSSYFPPRGEAPPPYEEAIASTSNCLPSTFMAMYNMGDNTQQDAQQNPHTEVSNGVTIATTSLSTTSQHQLPPTPPPVALQSQPDERNGSYPTYTRSSSSSMNNATPRVSLPSVRPSSGRSSTSSTLRRSSRTGANMNVEGHRRDAPPPLASSSRGTSSSVLAPFPPPYDYGELMRRTATLPRHRPELHRPQRGQQRLSLQVNVAGGGGDGWSSGSSSTLSTPNSPNGRDAPSLSSSSSSNGSAANVAV